MTEVGKDPDGRVIETERAATQRVVRPPEVRRAIPLHTCAAGEGFGTHMLGILEELFPYVEGWTRDGEVTSALQHILDAWQRVDDHPDKPTQVEVLMKKLARSPEERLSDKDILSTKSFGEPRVMPELQTKALTRLELSKRRGRRYGIFISHGQRLTGVLDAEIVRRRDAPPEVEACAGALQEYAEQTQAAHEAAATRREADVPTGESLAERMRRRAQIWRARGPEMDDEVGEYLEAHAPPTDGGDLIDHVRYWSRRYHRGRGEIPLDSLLLDFAGTEKHAAELTRHARDQEKRNREYGIYSGRPNYWLSRARDEDLLEIEKVCERLVNEDPKVSENTAYRRIRNSYGGVTRAHVKKALRRVRRGR